MSNSLVKKQENAVANRPSYLPQVTDDSAINQIVQSNPSMPILSLNDDVFTLMEGKEVLHEFKEDELTVFFLHINYTTQRRAFEGQWDENDPQEPICQSNDNIIPIATYDNPESDECKTCWRSSADTSRSDRCSYLRNSIVLLTYKNKAKEVVTAVARLRLNANSLYGEEDAATGVFNGESLLREFKRMNAELWFHPVLMYFDTDTKGARNKLNFELLYSDFPSEDQAEYIQDLIAEGDYAKVTALEHRTESSNGNDESGDEATAKAPRQRATEKSGAAGKKKANSRKKRAAKKDPEPDDSAGSDTASGDGGADESEAESAGASDAPSRSARSKRSARGRARAVEQDDAGDDSDSSSKGSDNVESLDDTDIDDMLDGMEMP